MISFLVNLSLEQEKDTKAMVLYYQKNNILSDDLKEDLSNPLLKDSDKAFFKYLESHSNSDYQSWEKSIQEEAISNQYVKRNNQDYFYQERLKVIAFMILSVVIFIISFKYFDYQLSTFGPLNISINGEILRRLPMVIAFILMLLSGFNVWLIIRTGPSKIVKYYNKAGIFIRTRKGDKLTEEIHSIKRFIHDFSILEESTKKNLVLWDDFLLYAVVLEENTIILDEIQTYKNSTILK